jgi:hypothetical protein
MTQIIRSLKSLTRQYRKACRRCGIRFPLTGAFYIVNSRGLPVRPDEVWADGKAVVTGTHREPPPEHPQPMTGLHIPGCGTVPISRARLDAYAEQDQPDPTPATNGFRMPACFRRHASVSPTDGRTKVSYKPVKNPKAGETYYAKGDDGRYKPVDFAATVQTAG